MVALDNSALLGARKARFGPGLLVGALALGCVVLVAGAILAHGFSENGFRLGSQLAWRYTCFVFFAALATGPVCRLTAWLWPLPTGHERWGRKLVWGFCASHGVYLLSVFLPNVIPLSPGALLMLVFGGGITLVMAVTVAPLHGPGGAPLIGSRVRRVLLGIATGYFWLCYCVMALARIAGPHRPDAFYDISLCLMLAALLLRFADHWRAQRRRIVSIV